MVFAGKVEEKKNWSGKAEGKAKSDRQVQFDYYCHGNQTRKKGEREKCYSTARVVFPPPSTCYLLPLHLLKLFPSQLARLVQVFLLYQNRVQGKDTSRSKYQQLEHQQIKEMYGVFQYPSNVVIFASLWTLPYSQGSSSPSWMCVIILGHFCIISHRPLFQTLIVIVNYFDFFF